MIINELQNEKKYGYGSHIYLYININTIPVDTVRSKRIFTNYVIALASRCISHIAG